MNLEALFAKLWRNYAEINPQAQAIMNALQARGEQVTNDHVAFRTFNLPEVSIEVLAKPFLQRGYQLAGKPYDFTQKKLFARHYEHEDKSLPKVFISELKVECFSEKLQNQIKELVRQVPKDLRDSEDFLTAGVPWQAIKYSDYESLLEESEYAAWMSAFGFRVNHFTVLFNSLKSFETLQELNVFIKSLGYSLNDSGGEIKGTPEELLEQSSTLAAEVEVLFNGGVHVIPSCYYEFARRYPDAEGNLFHGFIAKSADKIFESTDSKNPPPAK